MGHRAERGRPVPIAAAQLAQRASRVDARERPVWTQWGRVPVAAVRAGRPRRRADRQHVPDGRGEGHAASLRQRHERRAKRAPDLMKKRSRSYRSSHKHQETFIVIKPQGRTTTRKLFFLSSSFNSDSAISSAMQKRCANTHWHIMYKNRRRKFSISTVSALGVVRYFNVFIRTETPIQYT